MMMHATVTSKWLFSQLNNPDLVILDASEKENKSNLTTNFPNLQIPKARFFDTKKIFKDKKNPLPNMMPQPEVFSKECQKLGINNKSKIVVYDNLGVYNSPRVWWMFKVMGHESAAVLDGGLPDWINSGNQTELITNHQLTTGDFTAKYQSQLIKNSKQVLANISTQEFKLIDARSKGRFHGTSPEPRADLKGGHVPNSLNLPYTDVIRSNKFLKKEELAKVISRLNIKSESLVFTCGSGITACIILLAMELINSNPKSLYDGSWSEWGQLDGAPINQ